MNQKTRTFFISEYTMVKRFDKSAQYIFETKIHLKVAKKRILRSYPKFVTTKFQNYWKLEVNLFEPTSQPALQKKH